MDISTPNLAYVFCFVFHFLKARVESDTLDYKTSKGMYALTDGKKINIHTVDSRYLDLD